MKDVVNPAGKVVQVSENTPVKTINGVHYLLTGQDQAEIKAKEDAWQAKATERQEASVMAARRAEYGTAEEQLEYMAANGFDAWIQRINEINQRHPL